MICNSPLLPAWLPVISLSQCAVLGTEVRLAGQSDALQTLQGGAGRHLQRRHHRQLQQVTQPHIRPTVCRADNWKLNVQIIFSQLCHKY